MRLGYLLSEYPTPGHAFMRREVAGLEARGFDIVVASIRRPRREPAPGSPDVRAQARTFYVTDVGWARALGICATRALRHPVRLTRALRRACTIGDWHPRRLFAALCYLAEAIVAADWLQRRGVTHVHAHFASTVALLMGDMYPLSISMTLHGPDEFENPAGFHLREKVQASRFVIAISQFAASQILRYTPERLWGRVDVVSLGVDTAAIARRPLPPPSSPIRIVCAGRLAPVKGHHILLDALARVVEHRPDVVLHIAGDGPERAALDAHAVALHLENHVVFEGLLPEDRLHDLYRRADMFVLASFAEGVPVVLMEAMALGVPCISTWVAGVPELIVHDESGLLVAPADRDALAAAMLRLASDAALRDRLAVAGRMSVAAHYDIATNVAELARVFERRLAGVAQPTVSLMTRSPMAPAAGSARPLSGTLE